MIRCKQLKRIMAEENLSVLYANSSTLNYIDTNLWLGNLAAAANVGLLEEKKVKYLLTVNSFPLPESIRNLSFIKEKFIKVFDNPEDDLLSRFEETYEFIECGLKKGSVLIHCYHGISRSATVLLSYLMKKNQMTLNEALQYVKSKSESVEPNPGFLEQLKLYEIMNCTLDNTNIQYKMFKLHITFHQVKKLNALPTCCANVIQVDPLTVTVKGDPTVFKCRKCRRVLARGVNEIPHLPNGKYSWEENRSSTSWKKTAVCQQTYFVEPLVWMKSVNVSLEGKIHCPNNSCSNKLGSFSWVSGVQCPCGTKVCPGFSLIPSKVDKQKNV